MSASSSGGATAGSRSAPARHRSAHRSTSSGRPSATARRRPRRARSAPWAAAPDRSSVAAQRGSVLVDHRQPAPQGALGAGPVVVGEAEEGGGVPRLHPQLRRARRPGALDVGQLPPRHLGASQGQGDPGEERAHVHRLDRPALHLEQAGDAPSAGEHAARRGQGDVLGGQDLRLHRHVVGDRGPRGPAGGAERRGGGLGLAPARPSRSPSGQPRPGEEQARLGCDAWHPRRRRARSGLARGRRAASRARPTLRNTSQRSDGQHGDRAAAGRPGWRRPPRPGRRRRAPRARRRCRPSANPRLWAAMATSTHSSSSVASRSDSPRSSRAAWNVALVGAERSPVEEEPRHVGVVAVSAQPSERAPVGRQRGVEATGPLEHQSATSRSTRPRADGGASSPAWAISRSAAAASPRLRSEIAMLARASDSVWASSRAVGAVGGRSVGRSPRRSGSPSSCWASPSTHCAGGPGRVVVGDRREDIGRRARRRRMGRGGGGPPAPAARRVSRPSAVGTRGRHAGDPILAQDVTTAGAEPRRRQMSDNEGARREQGAGARATGRLGGAGALHGWRRRVRLRARRGGHDGGRGRGRRRPALVPGRLDRGDGALRRAVPASCPASPTRCG